jgi:hypothetical protein
VLSAAAEVDLELAPEGVADATLQGAQRLLLRLPLGDLALVVVGPARRGVADLGDCGQVEGVVVLAVAARVEPVARAGSAGGVDGGGAVVAGEPRWRGEPGRVADVAQDEPRDDRADTVQLEQRRGRRGDGVADAALGGGDVAVETTEVGQQVEGESLAFDPSSALGADAVEQLRGPVSPRDGGARRRR